MGTKGEQTMPGCPYATLGVGQTARAETIKKAYRKLAAKYHPDRNPGDDAAARRYLDITEAFEILSDPERRKKFDETGDRTRPRNTPEAQILNVIAPHLHRAVGDAVTCGTVKTSDLIKKVREAIKDEHRNYKNQLEGLHKGLAGMKEAASRVSVEGREDNLLAEFLNSQIRQVEAQIEGCTAAVERCQKALNYLEPYKYRVDGKSGASSVDEVYKALGGWQKIVFTS